MLDKQVLQDLKYYINLEDRLAHISGKIPNLRLNHAVYHMVKPTFGAARKDGHSERWLFFIKFTQLKPSLLGRRRRGLHGC